MNRQLLLGSFALSLTLGGLARGGLRDQKISATAGGLTGPLAGGDRFGLSAIGIGDLDGNGVPDAVVGSPQDDTGGSNRGAVRVLFLNTDGTVKAEQKIASGTGGFTGFLADGVQFGASVAKIGDLDGDGVVDILVGAPLVAGLGTQRGAVFVLFLKTDGTVKASQRISEGSGGFAGILHDGDQFGVSAAGIGDLDGDGVPDVAVGSHLDDDGGTNRGAIRLLALLPSGKAKATIKISSKTPGLTTVLSDNDRFGVSVAGLGDLDGDGVNDIAVGAQLDDTGGTDRGAVYVIFLKATGGVNGGVKIASGSGGFTGALDDSDYFGTSIANLGDLDGDGVVDLGVGALLDDDGGTDRGALWLLFLDTTGNVTANTKISSTAGGFTGMLDDQDGFARSATEVGDLDGDGHRDWIVGASGDDDGAADAGAAWVLFPDCIAPSAPSTVFNGTGVNPLGYAEMGSPILGTSWMTTVDLSSSGSVASIVQISQGGTLSGIVVSGFINGEVLIAPPYDPALTSTSVTGVHAIPVPASCSLLNIQLASQAATFKPGSFQLQNALVSSFGTF